MTYRIREMFLTLQGEGANTGRAVVLCRFSGCNLDCDFCDTDHEGTGGPGGGVYSEPGELADRAAELWPGSEPFRTILCTGGEPLLQLDESLINTLKRKNFTVLLETNGTREIPPGIDWVCVSPKSREGMKVKSGHELKLVYPLEGLDPGDFEDLDFRRFYLQPLWGPETDLNTRKAVKYCLEHPRWMLSLQNHKLTGLP